MTKKIKVRIALAVDPSGEDWCACGDSDLSDETVMDSCLDTLDGGDPRKYFIEAIVALPEAETIQGTAKEVK